jgi:hypothetical protein
MGGGHARTGLGHCLGHCLFSWFRSSAWMTAWPSLVQMDYLGPLLIFQSINRGKYLDSGENIQFVLKNLGPFGPRNGGWSSKH